MATTASLALLDQTFTLQLPSPAPVAASYTYTGGSDRLSQEIFSILESNFLFGASPLEGGGGGSAGRVRVLSIDGGADGGALAAAALVRLERRLQELSGNPAARVADFFDLAAGSGAGGFLAAALFACRMPAEAAREFVAKNRRVLSGRRGGGLLPSFRRARPESAFRKVFGDLTVRDAAKPLLIPCYDMASAAPFVFSRADAVEADAFDFPLWQVCAAACGVGPAEVASLDGCTRLRAAAAGPGGGGAAAAVANPTAVALTHVLHNKREFPSRPARPTSWCCPSAGAPRPRQPRRAAPRPPASCASAEPARPTWLTRSCRWRSGRAGRPTTCAGSSRCVLRERRREGVFWSFPARTHLSVRPNGEI